MLHVRIGDYPGQGEVTGMAHQGKKACHWCEGCWPKDPAYRRSCFGRHHRWLPQGDPLRPPGDNEPPPAARTPASIARDALRSSASDANWTSEEHPRKTSGVNSVSALSLVPLFNIVLDIMPDWMHIIKNLILPHFIKLVKGHRRLKSAGYKTVPSGPNATPEHIAAVLRCSTSPPTQHLTSA
jgi:hypothetical protein